MHVNQFSLYLDDPPPPHSSDQSILRGNFGNVAYLQRCKQIQLKRLLNARVIIWCYWKMSHFEFEPSCWVCVGTLHSRSPDGRSSIHAPLSNCSTRSRRTIRWRVPLQRFNKPTARLLLRCQDWVIVIAFHKSFVQWCVSPKRTPSVMNTRKSSKYIKDIRENVKSRC